MLHQHQHHHWHWQNSIYFHLQKNDRPQTYFRRKTHVIQPNNEIRPISQ